MTNFILMCYFLDTSMQKAENNVHHSHTYIVFLFLKNPNFYKMSIILYSKYCISCFVLHTQ